MVWPIVALAAGGAIAGMIGARDANAAAGARNRGIALGNEAVAEWNQIRWDAVAASMESTRFWTEKRYELLREQYDIRQSQAEEQYEISLMQQYRQGKMAEGRIRAGAEAAGTTSAVGSYGKLADQAILDRLANQRIETASFQNKSLNIMKGYEGLIMETGASFDASILRALASYQPTTPSFDFAGGTNPLLAAFSGAMGGATTGASLSRSPKS